MPFTPLHMGPAAIIKVALARRFSFMVFGWSQIAIDLQPLVVMLTGRGELHGFSHTLLGATLIALACGLTGKPLGELGLRVLRESAHLPISWRVSFFSAFLGTYSHIAIDSIMHMDVLPLAPLSALSPIHGLISVGDLHLVCIGAGLLGGVAWWWQQRRRANRSSPKA
jgi:hypothetical protein